MTVHPAQFRRRRVGARKRWWTWSSDGHWTPWTSRCWRRSGENPRAGALELSRITGVARGTVSSRLQRLEDSGVRHRLRARHRLAAAGFGVEAFVTLEIAQGALDDVQRDLEAIPGLLEAHATTGSGDVLCRVAASSHEGLQQILVDLNRSSAVVRSTSVVALSCLVPFRALPLLQSEACRTPDGPGCGATPSASTAAS